MALSLGIYIVIGVVTRTSDSDQYYVAGRGVPALYNGMATGSDWMSAASFISMAGALSVQGFSGLAYVMGWTGWYVLLAVFLGPYLRQFRRLPSLTSWGAATGDRAAAGGCALGHSRSFTYLIAQVTGVGLIVARFLGLDFNIGVFVGLVGVLFCSVLGGMRSSARTQVAQYIIPIISYLVPVVVLSWQLFTFLPPVHLRPAAAAEQRLGDPGDKRSEGGGHASSVETDADAATAKLKDPALSDAEREADRPAEDGGSAGEAARRPGRDHRKLPDGPQGRGDVELPRAHLLPDGGHGRIAPHPDPTTARHPRSRRRTSVAWGLFFIFLLYFTAPAYAAFARFVVYTRLVETQIADLPRWVTLWKPPAFSTWWTSSGTGWCSSRTS